MDEIVRLCLDHLRLQVGACRKIKDGPPENYALPFGCPSSQGEKGISCFKKNIQEQRRRRKPSCCMPVLSGSRPSCSLAPEPLPPALTPQSELLAFVLCRMRLFSGLEPRLSDDRDLGCFTPRQCFRGEYQLVLLVSSEGPANNQLAA